MPDPTPRFRTRIFLAWLVLVAGALALYFTHRHQLEVELLRELARDHHHLVIPVYLVLLSFLGLTFIPSTPFAIAGVLLFQPGLAYLLNLVGIVTSSTIVYHFARFVGFPRLVEARYPREAARVRQALNRKELPIIAAWSFFPAVPTDLMIYVASTLRVRLWKCILGVLVGEGILNAFYIFSVDLAL